MRLFLLLSRTAANRYARIHTRALPTTYLPTSYHHAHSRTGIRLSSTATRSEPILTRLQRLGATAAQALTSQPDTTKDGQKEPRLELRRLFQLANAQRRLIGFALAAQLVSASSLMLFPLALGKVVDTVTGAGLTDMDTLIAVLGGVFTVSAVASGTRVAAMSLAGSRISRSLRVSLFHSILRQETAFFDRRQSGELINRLSSDVPLVSRTLTENIAKMLRSGITSATSLGFILYLSPKLSLVTLCSIPPIVGCAVVFGRNARKLSRQLVDALASATQIAAERTSAIRTVRTFGAEEEESKRYANRVDETYGLASRVALADGIYGGSVQFSAQMSLLGVLWFGGRMVINPADPMTIGALTSFSMYAVNLGVAVSGLGTAYGQLVRALGAGFRIFEVIDREPRGASSTIFEQPFRDSSGTVGKCEGGSNTEKREKLEEEEDDEMERCSQGNVLEAGYDATVRFDNVSFEYPTQPDTPVLRGVNLEVRPGEIIAIAGTSGSGKSTLSALLSRLYEPTHGEIRLGDKPINDLDVGWLRRQVAVVAQEPILFNGSIKENIVYALNDDVSTDVIEKAAKAAASHDMILSLPDEYETMVGERGASLSGGQRARTALCRALAREPRVLVLDEHSAALDAESERAVSTAVLSAAAVMNMSVITIAHRTSSLRRAHKVAVLVDGVVAEIDSYDGLMRNENSYLSRMINPRKM